MVRCKTPTCTFPQDGKCLEGKGNTCPNLIADDVVSSSDALESSALGSTPYPSSESLYSGLPLQIDEAREFSRRSRAIVVALAGMKESGKTSLIARIHQQFQTGPVAGYDFGGSRTLWQFENLNWLATVESGVPSPTMERSSRQYDNSLLHLTVRQAVSGAQPIDLLLNDISGEIFPEAIATESVCQKLACLNRADHLALVVDGAAIADRGFRHDHCAKAKNFVQRVLQTGQIGRKTILHLIISKLDELLKPEHASESDEAAKRLESEFNSQFKDRVGRIHNWRVAARPLDGSMPTESIIAELFGVLVGSTLRYSPILRNDSASVDCARDFCRFGV